MTSFIIDQLIYSLALESPKPFRHMCLAFVAKQISPSLSYFYQAQERLFF